MVKGKNIELKKYLPHLNGDVSEEELVRSLINRDNVFLLAVIYYSLAIRNNDNEALLKSVKAFEMEGRTFFNMEIYGLAALAYRDAGKVLKQAGHWLIAEEYLDKSDEILKSLNTELKRRFI